MASKVVFGRIHLPMILRGFIAALGPAYSIARARGFISQVQLKIPFISTLFLAISVNAANAQSVKTSNQPLTEPKSTDTRAPQNNPTKSQHPGQNKKPKTTARDKSRLSAGKSAAKTSTATFTPYLAPDFTLKSTNGRDIKLSDFYGKVVMINFWASWCPPCRAEMPLLETLYKTHRHRGLVVLGLNVDVDTESRDEYLKDNPVSFPVLDDSKWATAKLYVSPSQPATFFVDRTGNIVHVHQGYKAGDDAVYAAKVTELLAY